MILQHAIRKYIMYNNKEKIKNLNKTHIQRYASMYIDPAVVELKK